MSLHFSLFIALLMQANTVEQPLLYRQLFIFGKEHNQVLVQQQLQLLNKATDAVKERDITIIVVEKDNSLYKKFNTNTAQFTLLLIGKDGTEKYRTHKLLQPTELFTLVDAMPMRKDEMRKH